MIDEQFLNSENKKQSLLIVKQHMLNEINYLINKTNFDLNNFDYSNFSIPLEINNLDRDTQHKLISILHLCESIIIIDSKIGDQNV